jgi:phenylalanine-4-hydroxylase
LEFVSGVTVKGQLRAITKHQHRNVLMSFSACTVTGPGGELLFDPDWGDYDMAVGERIVSVYPGAADPQHFAVHPMRSVQTSPVPVYSVADEAEFEIYAQIRAAREGGEVKDEELHDWLGKVQQLPGSQWLLLLELLELLGISPGRDELATAIRESLALLGNEHAQQALLIERGLRLLDNRQP